MVYSVWCLVRNLICLPSLWFAWEESESLTIDLFGIPKVAILSSPEVGDFRIKKISKWFATRGEKVEKSKRFRTTETEEKWHGKHH